MNWKKILTHGVALSAVQIVVGLAEGYLLLNRNSLLSPGSVVSFLASTAIFGHLAIKQADRTLLHAGLVLAFYAAVSVVLALVVSGLLGSVPWVLVAVEWLGVFLSAALGITAGRLFRRPRQLA